jgi:restriction endonuclease Mrr
MFNMRFEKTANEIKEKAKIKMDALATKIAGRQIRVSKLREEYGIDDGALVQLLTAARRQDGAERFSYYSNEPVRSGERIEERTIGAGVVNNLLTESDFIEADKANIKRLRLIVNNIRPRNKVTLNGVMYEEDVFPLDYEELEFLGF